MAFLCLELVESCAKLSAKKVARILKLHGPFLGVSGDGCKGNCYASSTQKCFKKIGAGEYTQENLDMATDLKHTSLCQF